MISEKKWDKFIKHLSLTGNVSGACAAVKICSKSLYNKRKADPEFEELYQDTLEYYLSQAELLVHETSQVDIGTAKWLLSRLRSDKYGVKKEVTHKGIEAGQVAEINISIKDKLAEIERLNGNE